MAQLGLHGLIGMALAGNGGFHAASGPARRTLPFAFVLGNLLPDADMFILGALYFLDSGTALSMHRTFSHSLIVAALLLAGSRLARREETRALGAGLSLGMVTHIAADVLVWFAPVTLLWPLNFWWPGIATVDLWAGVRPRLPELVPSLLGAAECGTFALYFLVLLRLERRFGEDASFLPTLRWLLLTQWAAFALYAALAFFLSASAYGIALYALFIPVFLPVALYTTVRMRATLGRLAETAPEK